MDSIIIKEDIIPEIKQVLELYNDVEWLAYTNDQMSLENAIANSLKLWTVWDKDRLVGLARVIGDGYTIIYIQDILILQNYQRKGLGSKLLQMILKEYKSVRQIVLMTEETEKTINFYQKNGLVKASDYNIITFIK